MKKTLLALLAAALAAALVIGVTAAVAAGAVPDYSPSVGYEYSSEKVKGEAIIEKATENENTLFLFGSSELSTTMIQSHPANFFTENDFGFNVCTVGRGSSQSLIHALILAGNGESLRGKKIVFLISPQHFVPEGIEPDMFVANFSQQQFLSAMNSDLIENATKEYLADRVDACFERYEADFGDPGFDTSRALAEQVTGKKSALIGNFLRPYYALEGLLFNLRDNVSAAKVIKSAAAVDSAAISDFGWDAYRAEMTDVGAVESDNNDFGILNDYYNTNIGKKLGRMENKDADLSYSQSLEYDDLKCLIEICRQLEIDALFVHTPLNGKWSDYCGFTADKRAEYYQNVRDLLDEYGCDYLDLTDKEYEPYYLCDVMHIGWLGWVDINEAISEFYNENK